MSEEIVQDQEIYPNGAHFGVIQLPIDLLPKPSAQRIIQWVNRNGKLDVYVSENAFIRAELLEHLHRMIRIGYQESVQKGGGSLHPIKTRLHWCRFTEQFCKTGKGPRVNPETGLSEEEIEPVPPEAA